MNLPGLEPEEAPAAAEVTPEHPDLWGEVVGQPDAVAALQAACTNPVHAYLLVGPEGSGKRAAARAFAAELLSRGLDAAAAARTARLVAEERHPCMQVVERDGPSISAEQAREVVRAAALAPPEGNLQVFVLEELHLVREAAAILLKSFEEPPPTTVFVALAEDVTEELTTVASRCVQVRFSAVPTAVVARHLRDQGVPEDVAEAAAASSGGSLRRAQLLVADPGVVARRAAWWSLPERLEDSGASVCALADELLEGVEAVLEPLSAAQAEEMGRLEAEIEELGLSRRGDRTRMEARHRREARRVRTDEVRAGLAALMDRYRQDLLDDGDPADFESAARAVQRTADSLRFNPNEPLALRALLLSLAPLGSREGSDPAAAPR